MNSNDIASRFAAQLEQNASREIAIKDCRMAQVRAYAAQKAAGIPQEQRCKPPLLAKRLTNEAIAALTKQYNEIAERPTRTTDRRTMLAQRVYTLTGLVPSASTATIELLEIIEDYEGPRRHVARAA